MLPARLKNIFRPVNYALIACLLLFAAAPGLIATAATSEPLRLAHRIKLPAEVKGRFDHFGVDLQGGRLFLAAESMHQVLVLNLQTGMLLHRITAVQIPHAIVFRQSGDRIYITDGGAGAVKIFDGKSYRLLKTIKLQVDADSVAYDHALRYLYVVNGGEDAHSSQSFISVIDMNKNTKTADIKLDSPHVEAMALDTSNSRLYVNDTAKNAVDVVERGKNTVITSWLVKLCKQNVPAAVDSANRRLFVGCRNGKISIFDTQTGREIQGLAIGKGADDLTYSPDNKRIYVSCGADDGSVYVFQQKSADQYESLGRVTTGPGARNSIYIASLHELYVSVPAHGATPAEILVYRDQ